MNPNLAEIIFILDKSGSMGGIKSDAIGGFNQFLEDQKSLPGKARFTLVLFDHEYMLVHNGADLPTVPALSETTYQPRGTTALLDAIGRTIHDVGQRLANTPEADRPGKVIVTILTDGMENASKDYAHGKVAEMIKHQTDKYQWEFIFLAANIDSVRTGTALNIPAASSRSFTADSHGSHEAFSIASRAVSLSRMGGSGTGAKAKKHDDTWS